MPISALQPTILMADDDSEDCQLVGDALRATGQPCELRFVRNGEELLHYLRHQRQYESAESVPPPDLILLDLKMPGKDGHETLRELKSDPQWRCIPVVVLTTSASGNDVTLCYQMGVNAYVTKPATFCELVRVLEAIVRYWFEVAELPPAARNGPSTQR
jgi:CheY-like chemotaxis protein